MPKKGTNIYKRKDGRWEARYVKTISADGSKKYGSVYGKAFSEAKEKQEFCIRTGNLYQSKINSHTLSKIIYEWLEFSKNSIKKSTYQKYESIILAQLKSMIALANNHSDEFYAMATEKGKAEAKMYYASAEKEKSQLTTRLHELDNIIRCLYEDRVVGRITPERYDFLASGYEEEQAQIRTKLNELNGKINEIDLQGKYVKDFIAKAKEYNNIEKLTPEILHAFIKRIDVY